MLRRPPGPSGPVITSGLRDLERFLSVRSTWLSLVVLAAVGLISFLVGGSALPSIQDEASFGDAAVTPVLAAAPLITSTVLGLSLEGSMAGPERLGARDLSAHRLLHLGIVTSSSMVALWPAISISQRPDAASMTLENLLAATALVLVLGSIGRADLAWLGLFPYGLLGLIVGPGLPPGAAHVFLINPSTEAAELVVNCVAFLLACAFYLWRRRPTRSRHGGNDRSTVPPSAAIRTG